jgi:hypothetical protein
MGNYIYKKGTVQPLTIDVTEDTVDTVDTVEQETTATESLKEQITRIENNYTSDTSPTVTVANIPCIYKNKKFDFENKGRPNQLLSNFSNDISAALQNENGTENDNKVCAKTPKNSPRADTKETFEHSDESGEDIPDEDISDEENADTKNDKKDNRTSCGICDSWVVKEDMSKQEEDAFKEFYKMMRDIML